MLARTFLSAAALKMSDAEHAALVRVLNALERGEISYMPAHFTDTCLVLRGKQLTGFNMVNVAGENDCGTYGCLLGWARFLASDYTLFQRRPSPDYVGDLFRMSFNPDDALLGPNKSSAEITVEEAAQALHNFLSTGKARWHEVCPKP